MFHIIYYVRIIIIDYRNNVLIVLTIPQKFASVYVVREKQ